MAKNSPKIHLKAMCIVGLMTSLTLLGCSKENTQRAAQSEDGLLFKPSNAVNFGRQSALIRQLAQVWHLQEVDGIAPHNNNRQPILLDLSTIEQQVATLSIDKNCQPIHISLETRYVSTGSLTVREIQRELNPCSTQLEDSLMAMIADIRTFEPATLANNKLVLNSFQNKLVFVPYAE